MSPTPRRPRAGRAPSSRASQRRVLMLLALGFALAPSGCIIIPFTPPTPVHEEGIVDDDALESLIGLDERAVLERMGPPDHAGPRGRARVVVYQGERRYATDIYVAVAGGYTAGGAKLDDAGGITRVLRCHVLVLDATGIVRDFEIVNRPTSGISRRDEYGHGFDPVADCAEVVWAPSEREHLEEGTR